MAWVGLAPTVADLHRALSNHAHVYCLEHHRIEDAGPRKSAASSDARPGAVPKASSDAASVDSRPACQFAAFNVQALTLQAIDQRLPPAVIGTPPADPIASACQVIDVLFNAPKKSPPRLV